MVALDGSERFVLLCQDAVETNFSNNGSDPLSVPVKQDREPKCTVLAPWNWNIWGPLLANRKKVGFISSYRCYYATLLSLDVFCRRESNPFKFTICMYRKEDWKWLSIQANSPASVITAQSMCVISRRRVSLWPFAAGTDVTCIVIRYHFIIL